MTTNFATQVTLPKSSRAPGLHVALIPDGNGRWATSRGLARAVGHRRGVRPVREAAEAAPSLGISTLSVYGFSSDNWKRPEPEVREILGCIREFVASERARCVRDGVRLTVIGRRDRLPRDLVAAIEETERATARCAALHLRLAVDYSARGEIVAAARRSAAPPDARAFDGLLGADLGGRSPDVDLLVRTGGEQRLSDFMLWECAYAELVFLDVPWPDFRRAHLGAAVDDFRLRERRFGGLPRGAASPAT
ncbi:MAG: Ditrans,polycis-undecaprenyl-diphosphate synthase ((2E,6E)-farnesyl-diphosphate specific) [Planctomycetes bacterium]|nr:Ditrans,polycis-undecaprenyl-diphosphate synthase ((2E,6E)-farnesyl-diphosphate specific) [Planctomycetota bacterium]